MDEKYCLIGTEENTNALENWINETEKKGYILKQILTAPQAATRQIGKPFIAVMIRNKEK